MRSALVLQAAFLCTSGVAVAGGKGGGRSVSVNGYYRKDGTYVRPHTRSAPGSGSAPPATYFPPAAPRTTPPAPPRAEPPPVEPRADARTAPPAATLAERPEPSAVAMSATVYEVRMVVENVRLKRVIFDHPNGTRKMPPGNYLAIDLRVYGAARFAGKRIDFAGPAPPAITDGDKWDCLCVTNDPEAGQPFALATSVTIPPSGSSRATILFSEPPGTSELALDIPAPALGPGAGFRFLVPGPGR